MRVYTADEEERVRVQAHVRAWARAGLLDPTQRETLDTMLRTDLKRTKPLLRAALGAFTTLIALAAVGLVLVTVGLRNDAAVAVALTGAALLCFGAANYLATSVRLYRYGIEEALAALSPVLLAIATVAFVNARGRTDSHLDTMAALIVGAAAACVVYRRFGFVYAGIGAIVCAAFVPTQFDLPSSSERMCVAAVFGAMFFVARAAYRNHGDDFPGDEYAMFEAAACVGAYLTLNLHAWNALDTWAWRASIATIDPWFYWTTYAATWLIPAAALVDAIRAKDRPLLVAGIATALVTLATNKPYLGVPRQSWDPMLLGVLLVGAALGVRRWLASGPGGARNGYTPERLLHGDRDLLETAANVSVAWHGRVHEPPASVAPSPFDGGRSGGGGGGATF